MPSQHAYSAVFLNDKSFNQSINKNNKNLFYWCFDASNSNRQEWKKKMLGVKVIKRVEIWILNSLPVDGIHDTHFDT